VLEAGDGKVALEMLETHAGEVGLLVLDLDMPELDGESTFDALRARGSSVPVVFLTGLCDEARKHALLERGAFELLTKPCTNALLRRTIQAALTPPGAP
jgi:DNA-binding response OmpR family regulator